MKVGFWMEDGAVRVEVITYIGKNIPYLQPADLAKLQKVTVATRLVHENETVTVNETELFGIEAIGIRVIRANPWSIGPPEITNKTQALTVTAVSEERPAFTVTTRNVSHQCITAIRWYGLENGRKGGGSGLSGRCVIPAGRIFNLVQHFAPDYQQDAEEVQPRLPGRREVVIEAILLQDGTFEGEADAAAEMAANMTGENLQRTRVLELLRSISTEDVPQALSQLKREVTSLSEEVDEALTAELSQRFASASPDTRQRRIKEDVRNGLRFTKSDLLHRIERFEYQREHSPEDADFVAWLKGITKTFEGMTPALSKN